MDVKYFYTKKARFSGTRYEDIYDAAYGLYCKIKRKSKRRPYLRSAYFAKEKIFLELFWRHLDQKNWRDRARRMRYLACAYDLIENSHFKPESKINPNDSSEILHRFFGITPDKRVFIVQIKEERKSGKKWLLSVFPKE